MLQLRKSQDRGQAHHGWLNSHFSFSFAEYYDKNHMGFRSLRVINEDHIQGGAGFGSHPHRDMEIITYVIKGGLKHKDSMGNEAVILPGEVQRMSAGTGVFHSEHSHFPDQETHLFQIWITPNARGGEPSYAQKSFENDLQNKKLVLVVSEDGREGSLSIKQDADVYISRLKAHEEFEYKLRPGRGLWIQMVRGHIDVNGKELQTGDAVALTDEENLRLKALNSSEILIFDLA